MATTTENLGMTLPDTTDLVDVTVLNGNFSTLDNFAGTQTEKDTEQDDRLTALENSDTEQDTAIAGMAPFLSGKKVYEHFFGSTSGSDTFTINKSDFGSGSLTNCGVYLIYRVSWSYTPAISIYALAYTGNRTEYTSLQKIAGDDFDISVAQDVLSFTTAGKIQIIAIA